LSGAAGPKLNHAVHMSSTYPDQWGFWEWLGQTPRLVKSPTFPAAT
jgi:hypothetical protein